MSAAGPTERVYASAPTDSWWHRYVAELTWMTPTGLTALHTDTTYLLEEGVFGAGQPGEPSWPESRVRTGLVMGSVQSGKTASMLGLTASALDRGVDIVILLAGTRVSLWHQTLDRLIKQLDQGTDDALKARRRLICPPSVDAAQGVAGSLQDTYRLPSASVRRKLARRTPLIIVAMKQTSHLYALGSALRGGVFDAVTRLERPVHMLVLDDEADDGSVLDARIEAVRDPLSSDLKQTPRAIADLWDPRAGSAPENLFATYVGYTATPQANLLQEDHNPLAPRDFVVTLRTPLDVGFPVEPPGASAPRSSSYPEPMGLSYYYTGGEVYYDRGTAAGLCVATTGDAQHDLGEAIRAFLVAGAIRLSRSPEKTGPHSLATAEFESFDAVADASPDPHSMLFHPSADIGDHFAGAENVLMWAGVRDREQARAMLENGDARLPEALVQRMLGEEQLWQAWVDRFRASMDAISSEFNVFNPGAIPDWPTVRDLLVSEIIPGTRVSVVNSDPNADDRPQYASTFDDTRGTWRAAADVSTIFVSGNVMARGLTLEGLSTVLFQRQSNNPYADTQMQMQRWFGYRGKYIELCRVFASGQQLGLFSHYHDTDEALRQEIAARMTGVAPSPLVLHGSDFLATGKIANLGRMPLCPGAKPFVTLINSGEEPDPNAELVASLFSAPSSEVVVGGRARGRALDRTLSLDDAARVINGLRFTGYRPGRDNQWGELWSQVQSRVSDCLPLRPDFWLYDPPAPIEGQASPVRVDCPYRIPAYFRLWAACLDRPVRGLFVTGAPSELWSMADLPQKQRQQPKFSVGIRFGSGEPVSQGPLAGLPFKIPATNKRVADDGDLGTTWGANDPAAGPLEYRGDEYFDYYARQEALPTRAPNSSWRPAGSDGQILFYVNHPAGQRHPVVAVGVCIPAGGPEQFAATRANFLASEDGGQRD